MKKSSGFFRRLSRCLPSSIPLAFWRASPSISDQPAMRHKSRKVPDRVEMSVTVRTLLLINAFFMLFLHVSLYIKWEACSSLLQSKKSPQSGSLSPLSWPNKQHALSHVNSTHLAGTLGMGSANKNSTLIHAQKAQLERVLLPHQHKNADVKINKSSSSASTKPPGAESKKAPNPAKTRIISTVAQHAAAQAKTQAGARQGTIPVAKTASLSIVKTKVPTLALQKNTPAAASSIRKEQAVHVAKQGVNVTQQQVDASLNTAQDKKPRTRKRGGNSNNNNNANTPIETRHTKSACAPESGSTQPCRHRFIFSPHYDDAVLSLGGVMSFEPCATTIVTFFAGEPVNLMSTQYDLSCNFTDSHQAMTARKKENRLSLEYLGVAFRDLDFIDDQYEDVAPPRAHQTSRAYSHAGRPRPHEFQSPTPAPQQQQVCVI
jgi:hypothetical protein